MTTDHKDLPKKIEPGNELHFALLGTPWHFNLLRGKDYADMQGFARAVWDAATEHATQQALAARPGMLDGPAIREIFLAHGFTIKEGQTDLKPYVYAAARALIAADRAKRGEQACPALPDKLAPTGWAYGLKDPCVAEVEVALKTLQMMWDYCDDIKRNHRAFGGTPALMCEWSQALTVVEKLAVKYVSVDGPSTEPPVQSEPVAAADRAELAGEVKRLAEKYMLNGAGSIKADLHAAIDRLAATTVSSDHALMIANKSLKRRGEAINGIRAALREAGFDGGGLATELPQAVRDALRAMAAAAHSAPAPAQGEQTRSQKMAAAGFTPRDTRIECDDCGAKCTPQILPVHKCEAAQGERETTPANDEDKAVYAEIAGRYFRDTAPPAQSREAFEAFFRYSRASKGKSRLAELFNRLPDDTYAADHVQRHWWTWQQARAALAAQPPRPSDDALWDQTLRERDDFHDWADKLAEAIAEHTGADIGEHSSDNNPWWEALNALAAQPAAAPVCPRLTDECPYLIGGDKNAAECVSNGHCGCGAAPEPVHLTDGRIDEEGQQYRRCGRDGDFVHAFMVGAVWARDFLAAPSTKEGA